MHWLDIYIHTIETIRQTGADTEGSYRPAIDALLHKAAAENTATAALHILHEPQRRQGNAPDFRITNAGGAVVGYVECKKPDTNLSRLLRGEQLHRYTGLSPNILLTDGWRWLLVRDGKSTATVTITQTEPPILADFRRLLNAFFCAPAEQIGDAKRLAAALAVRCQLLREDLFALIGNDHSKLHGLFEAFRKLIYHDMQAEQFADAFAQTTVYSLLMARLQAGIGTKLDLFTVEKYIPQTFSLIRELSGFLRELDREEYRELAWIVSDILAIINNMDPAAVTETLTDAHTAGATTNTDPFLYFYENFLAAYDPTLRMKRGVYYTPLPVVRFIVRAIDDILRNDLGIYDGLADRQVTALDFATGTGTFLLETMRRVLHGKSSAECRLLTNEHLLKNCYGFEFLIAPYTIAHLKLSQFLADRGCGLDKRQPAKQLKIFLTNTLEEGSQQSTLPLLPALSEEARFADKIKENPILVIMGNPPYSVVSQNNGAFIKRLVRDYYQVDGASLGERNPKVLQDDYVKFIRFAQHKMQSVERGIVAIITNHGFLDNPTFRGLRRSLMTAFDRLYFLDLHGNAKKKETAANGGKDENVFDIQQGVGISLLIKNPDLTKGIFHYDVFGKRDVKYEFCEANTIQSIKWRKLKPTSPFYLFIPQNKKSGKQYQSYTSITDIFSIFSTGIKTHRDHFAFAFDKENIETRMKDMLNPSLSNTALRQKYNITDSDSWNLTAARRQIMNTSDWSDNICSCLYRPFDIRWCHLGQTTMDRPRQRVMRHLSAGDNLGIIVSRSATGQQSWQDVQVTGKPIEFGVMSTRPGNSAPLFPLYLYDENANGNTLKTENIKPAFRHWLDQRYGEKLSPESIIGYLYALLHCPNYRRRYIDFLRIDFPRIPFTKDLKTFHELAAIGHRLIQAHLLKDPNLHSPLSLHGDNLIIEKVRYNAADNKLFINPQTGFAPLSPEVFHFPIGGYYPLDKYLKSRKHRKLTLLDVQTIKKTAAAIAFTIDQMTQIDQYDLHP